MVEFVSFFAPGAHSQIGYFGKLGALGMDVYEKSQMGTLIDFDYMTPKLEHFILFSS